MIYNWSFWKNWAPLPIQFCSPKSGDHDGATKTSCAIQKLRVCDTSHHVIYNCLVDELLGLKNGTQRYYPKTIIQNPNYNYSNSINEVKLTSHLSPPTWPSIYSQNPPNIYSTMVTCSLTCLCPFMRLSSFGRHFLALFWHSLTLSESSFRIFRIFRIFPNYSHYSLLFRLPYRTWRHTKHFLCLK